MNSRELKELHEAKKWRVFYEKEYNRANKEYRKERDDGYDNWKKWDKARFELEQVTAKLKAAKQEIENLQELGIANERYKIAVRNLQERLCDTEIKLLETEVELAARKAR